MFVALSAGTGALTATQEIIIWTILKTHFESPDSMELICRQGMKLARSLPLSSSIQCLVLSCAIENLLRLLAQDCRENAVEDVRQGQRLTRYLESK